MNKKLYIVLAIVVAVLVGVFLFFSRPANVSAPVPPASESLPPPTTVLPASPPPAAVAPQPDKENAAAITYTDSGFSPATLIVKVGTTVTFQNKSSDLSWPASNIHPTHALYDGTSLAEHCQNGTSDTFDTCKGIAPGDSWSFKFNKVGSWKYHDHLNPTARGIVVVQ